MFTNRKNAHERPYWHNTVVAIIVLFVGTVQAAAAEDSPAQTVSFDRQIRPILADKCFACHGPDEASREGGLRLDRKDAAISEADSGSRAIVPGEPQSSEVMARIITDDEDLRMPPPDSGKSLSDKEKQLLRAWIAQGAEWKEHWAYLSPTVPSIPTVKDRAWLTNPIDLFILHRLEREGVRPSPPAERHTLLRRVTFDLTGLPPTINEVEAFLKDTSADAYETVVDRLLSSERYGEHMARYWLDAARYGDTHGLHLDNYREMWPYRDWVIRAFNQNLPFDQFIIKQLAGDLLPAPTQDDLLATGFNRCHVTTNEGGSIKKEVFVRNVVDRVVTTGTVFMGMTLECTRCHDHKYDPVTMKDFYSLFAFFNSLDGEPMDGNAARHAPIIKLPTEEQVRQKTNLQLRIDDLKNKLKLAREGIDFDALEGETAFIEWREAEADATAEKRPKKIQELLDKAPNEEDSRKLREYFVNHVWDASRPTLEPLLQEQEKCEKEAKELDEKIASSLIFRELEEARPAYVLHRGEYDQPREEVKRATPSALPPMPDDTSLDRLGLATWLTSPTHPLTARVTVNRFWQQVFGMGIVKTAEDFGSQGEPPSHPKLIDWMSVQFRDEGWDVKATMKRLVMSSTYRQSSRTTAELLQRDPDNRLLARGPRYRLDAEMLRDQALAISGLLRNTLGGPSVKPPQPDGLWHAVGYTGSNTSRFKADKTPEKVHRRSIYTFFKRTSPPPQMSTFDSPSREFCTVRRERTNTPLQALLLLNDPQYVEAARALASRGITSESTTRQRAQGLFQLATCRTAGNEELTELMEAFRDHYAAFQKAPEAARSLLSLGVSEPQPSIDATELAAWTMIGNLLLNLDEVVNKN